MIFNKKIIRVFPRRTKWTPNDELSFIGDPPIIGEPKDYPVYISCTFTWDIPECERLFRSWSAKYTDVKIGGPAFGDCGGEFTPGMFVKSGVVFTSRGCNKDCPWCFVHEREGNIREISIKNGHIIQDNNLLGCSMDHVINVFKMLKKQKHAAQFIGGLDAELITEKHVDLLNTIKVDRMFFAYDHMGDTYYLEKAAEMLSNFSIDKKRCYVLINYYKDDSVEKAERRLLKIWKLGFMPFSMYYQKKETPQSKKQKEWQHLTRIFSRPAIMRGYCKKHFSGEGCLDENQRKLF